MNKTHNRREQTCSRFFFLRVDYDVVMKRGIPLIVLATASLALADVGSKLTYEFDEAKPQIHVRELNGVVVANVTLKNTTTDEVIKPDRLELVADEKTGEQFVRFPGFENGVLPDGLYTCTIGPEHLDFFVLAGDINRDRKVDTLDFNILSGNFGVVAARYSNGDLNYDGAVDSKDLNIYQAQVGKSLPAPATQPTTQPQ